MTDEENKIQYEFIQKSEIKDLLDFDDLLDLITFYQQHQYLYCAHCRWERLEVDYKVCPNCNKPNPLLKAGLI